METVVATFVLFCFLTSTGVTASFTIGTFSQAITLRQSSTNDSMENSAAKDLFRVRTVTAFVELESRDFKESSSRIEDKVKQCNVFLRAIERELTKNGYEVQTLRIATNPFGEWLVNEGDTKEATSHCLEVLDSSLADCDIGFCNLGPSQTAEQTRLCPQIVKASPRFSCSANVDPCNVECARAAARCILQISTLMAPEYVKDGLGNFRFCAAASCKPFIPFNPAAKSGALPAETIGIALGLENGRLAKRLLKQCASVEKIPTVFAKGMQDALQPLEDICKALSKQGYHYLGIDSSLNPSLDPGGSVAGALEQLEQVPTFGACGTLAAASAITTSLQSLSLKLTGYCGLMLPLCEDLRLAELASKEEPMERLRITDLLSISSVCGVGVDTVPVPGDVSEESLTGLILDVAGLAGRWQKSLSVRVFPVVGSAAGDFTTFDSPYMCNSRILELE